MSLLDDVKSRTWFYEFELPDGSVTKADIPNEVRKIHTSRRAQLRKILAERVQSSGEMTALDFASHEGYYSVELARHFKKVIGLEIRQPSICAASSIAKALGVKNVTFVETDLETMQPSDAYRADFVLLFGLLYHLENPIHVLRLASDLTRKHLLIETQVFPFELTGLIENGHYEWQREIHGLFTLVADDHGNREGGSTDLALVPTVGALQFLLRTFGFKTIEVLPTLAEDYEQFRRGARVLIYASK